MGLRTLFYLILACLPGIVWSHARLMSPPSRSSMWRLGFPTPINFNDNQLYCGGLTIQIKNGGKCGICGDPYNMPHPRHNEAGGKYGLGIISKRYISGQVIDATVDVTTNHRGYFEFKLCPNNNPKKEATQDCLDKYLLKEAHGSGTRYYVGDKSKGEITLQLQLPKGLTCSQCVFQWTYVAGNNWGKCPDGNEGLGCGPQETFRGCADIAIHKDGDFIDVKPNEIDVENKHNEISPHKNKNHGHNNNHIPDVEFATYNYEVTKQSRQNTSKTDLVENHNSSYHDHFHTNVRPKNSTIIFRFPSKPLASIKQGPNSSERRPHVSNNRRKYKYENRSFYHFKTSRPSSNKSPFDQNWDFLMNNNRWPLTFEEIKSKGEKDPFRQRHDAQKSKNRSTKQMKIHGMISSDREEDTSASKVFDPDGIRYKDFWLL